MLLFLQIGAEMWDFDLSGKRLNDFMYACACVCFQFHVGTGNFYFDKAVDGFLKDLFQKWKVCHIFITQVTARIVWH